MSNRLPNSPARELTFSQRHNGSNAAQTQAMLAALGFTSLQELTDAAIPEAIVPSPKLPTALTQERKICQNAPLTELQTLSHLRKLSQKNQLLDQMIGQGYYDTTTPAVLRRNLLESPGWYTGYTPYQPEISQGRLEALLTFQTVVQDLTGLPVANASLLDEATATAEAVALMRRANRKGQRILLDQQLHPQVVAVVAARAWASDTQIEVADLSAGLIGDDIIGIVAAQVGTTGQLQDLRETICQAKERGALVTVATDLLALTLINDPADLGADIAVGSAQRFGVPFFFGGPHAAFLAVRQELQRQMPGRLVGVAKDADGQVAYRLALQTREQHIRREKATSNICTAQALLAELAAMYALWHGPEGLRAIAQRIHAQALLFAEVATIFLKTKGQKGLIYPDFFDTVMLQVEDAEVVRQNACEQGINLRVYDRTHICVSFGEGHGYDQSYRLLLALGAQPQWAGSAIEKAKVTIPEDYPVPAQFQRQSDYLTHPNFTAYHSETKMMRYLRTLADRDLALDRSMIPLGSCTMKLNSSAEMEAISWPEFAGIHPFVPPEQARGWQELLGDLDRRLLEITGYDVISHQPNSGAQGEFAGLLAIRRFHESRDQGHRRVCLIAQSAHGTNAASAVMAGLQVVVVATDTDGSIDVVDLRGKIDQYCDELAAIMITYPSTHGVFEGSVTQVCDWVHQAGAQVYIDGANLNALVGLAQPGRFGGDVSHLNLHKTFAIPHGGGGPGVGPIVAKSHLQAFLPGNPQDVVEAATKSFAEPASWQHNYPVSGTNHGSPGVMPISWAYLVLMGDAGLKEATGQAILAANYIARKLQDYFPVLYTGQAGLVAHECILDLRPLTKATGVSAEDVAKRLIDFGFHAPTLAFPVPGTLMVEPTESEDKGELDRFIDAMRIIRAEIDQVARAEVTLAESVLRQAPHTASCALDEWNHPYSREQALFPDKRLRLRKYFPPVRRIDGAGGDRNFICSCPPVEEYLDSIFDSEVSAGGNRKSGSNRSDQ